MSAERDLALVDQQSLASELDIKFKEMIEPVLLKWLQSLPASSSSLAQNRYGNRPLPFQDQENTQQSTQLGKELITTQGLTPADDTLMSTSISSDHTTITTPLSGSGVDFSSSTPSVSSISTDNEGAEIKSSDFATDSLDTSQSVSGDQALLHTPLSIAEGNLEEASLQRHTGATVEQFKIPQDTEEYFQGV